MTPILGLWPVRCASCQAVAYLGDSPPADRFAALADLGDHRCPRGGVDCPSTSAALAASQQGRLGAVAAEVDALRSVSEHLEPIAQASETVHTAMLARIDALEARTPVVRIATTVIATLLAGDSTTITVAWPDPMPTASYDVAVSNPLTVVTVTSRTTTAVTVTLRTATLLTAATITLVAVGWST